RAKGTPHELHGGAAARVVLNGPPGNVLDGEMIAELTWAARELAGRARLRAIVIEGEGAHFSYGAAVQEHLREAVAGQLTAFRELLFALSDAGVPLVAKVRGQCLGGGMELAALCHFVIADRTARFGQPELRLGVFAPAASVLLPLRIGQSRADEMLLAGRVASAEEAVAWGLATAVADWDGLDEECDR